MENKQEKIKWYESGNVITNLIIGTIIAIIVCSQSFAVITNASLDLFSSVINHNSIYLLILVYFILLKTKFGKQYFNYLNIFLVFLYLISTITSLLTVFQSFSLNTILAFVENCVLSVYLIHTMFRDTRLWNDYHIGKSPFNEISNDGYYNALIVIVVFTLVINLISTVVVSGLFISILDAIYILLFGRYIYLYREYLDYHKLDSNNEGNFDEIRKDIQNVLDSTTIDDKAIEMVDKIKDTASDVMDKTGIIKKKEVKKRTVKKKDDSNNTKKTVKKRTTKKGDDK